MNNEFKPCVRIRMKEDCLPNKRGEEYLLHTNYDGDLSAGECSCQHKWEIVTYEEQDERFYGKSLIEELLEDDQKINMKYRLKKETPMYPKGTIGSAALRQFDDGKTWLFRGEDEEYFILLPTERKDEWIEEVDERWKPELGQEFFWVNYALQIEADLWRNKKADDECFTSLNLFRTRELAERAAEQIKALLKEFHKNNP